MPKINPSILSIIPEDVNRFNVLDLKALGRFDSLPFDPGFPALLYNLDQSSVNQLCSKLNPYKTVEVTTIDSDGKVQITSIDQIVTAKREAIFVPTLQPAGSFDQFRDIIARLRNPEDGCPWDTKQTIASLRSNLLEECYEGLEAIDTSRYEDLEEELGDLLLIIVLLSQIGEESKIFNAAGMIRSISEKIIRRHPHIFADTVVAGVEDVFSNWEEIKKQERAKKDVQPESILESIPVSLPALSQAELLQKRAARVGFDWPDIDPVLEKIQEEANEINNTTNQNELEDEIGDLFFVLVNFARWKKIDAETALQKSNRKFRNRFRFIENQVAREGLELKDKSLDELDAYWNEAKKVEGGL